MMKTKKAVHLVEAPFAFATIPGLAPALLKAVLQKNGISCYCHYLNLKLLDSIGKERIQYLGGMPCLGNFMFARWLFPEHEMQFQNHEQMLSKTIPSTIAKRELAKEVKEVADKWVNQLVLDDVLFVGFSVGWSQLLASLYLAQGIKQRLPSVPIVFGGTLCGIRDIGISLLKKFSQIDVISFEEGEETIIELANSCSAKESLHKIAGIGYRDKKNQVVTTQSRPKIRDLDAIPIPDHSDYVRQLGTHFVWQNAFPIQMSRGCSWNRCAFCENPGASGKLRSRSAQSVLKEIFYINEKHRAFFFFFVDSEITGAKEELIKLCELLIRSDKTLILFACARVSHLSKEILELMRRAGFVFIQLGIESFSSSLLKKIRKGATAMDNIAALKHAAEVGIRAHYNLMSYFPGETESEIECNLDILRRLRHFGHMATNSHFMPQRGAYVTQHLDKYGIDLREPNDDWIYCFPENIQADLAPVFFQFFNANENDSIRNLWACINKEMSCHAGRFLFYLDTGKELVILDTREEKLRQTILNTKERDIILFCNTRRTLTEIYKAFSNYDPSYVRQVLSHFAEEGILYGESNEYINLVLRGNGDMFLSLTKHDVSILLGVENIIRSKK
jgi:ribosomal peptide maturation radical SAM protein 1